MALTITATPPAPAVTAPPPKIAAPAANAAVASAGSAAGSAQQTAALNRLMAKYKYDLTQDAAAGTLSSLGRQITAAAKAAGHRVTLPRAPAGSAAALATPAATTAPQAGKVNVTA